MPTPEGRALTSAETELIRWLLINGEAGAERFLAGVESLRVVASCKCGCASVDFTANMDGEMAVVSDFGAVGPDGMPGGVFLFTRGGRLAGLEVWSPGAPITELPAPASLRPLPSK